MSRQILTCLLATMALATACDEESSVINQVPEGVAFVTVVNTTPRVVKPYVGSQLASTADLQAATWMPACANIPAGSQTVTFRALDSSVVAATPSTTFASGQRYTAILTNDGATSSTIVLPETFVPVASNSYGLRIVNATGRAGDFFVTTPAGTVAGAPTASLTNNTATGGDTGVDAFRTLPTLNTRVRMFATGTTAGVLADFNPTTAVSVPWTQGVTVVFTRTSTGGIATFQTMQCMP